MYIFSTYIYIGGDVYSFISHSLRLAAPYMRCKEGPRAEASMSGSPDNSNIVDIPPYISRGDKNNTPPLTTNFVLKTDGLGRRRRGRECKRANDASFEEIYLDDMFPEPPCFVVCTYDCAPPKGCVNLSPPVINTVDNTR